MDITTLVAELDDKQLGALGDALKMLPSRKLARVLMHLTVGHKLPSSVEYHVIMGTRQLLSQDDSCPTSADVIKAEQQMAG